MNPNYIWAQIQRYNTALAAGRQALADDCLFRIGSHADLLQPGEEINNQNRDRVLAWVRDWASNRVPQVTE